MTTRILNGVDLERLSGTVEAVTAEPSLGHFQFRARNEWIDGGHSRTTIQGFYGAGQEDTSRERPFVLESDEPPVLLGRNQAANAGEYALQALAACLTGTLVYHAAARGVELDAVECTVHGDLDVQGFLGLNGEVRPGYERIQVTIKVDGDLDDAQLAEVASLAQFSPVRDTIVNPVTVGIDVTRA
ncbi:MAG TPA: OsmC family protein [Actinomycetes bacterium]|nr:OsmC family protein [Actinomycetes bacterium]